MTIHAENTFIYREGGGGNISIGHIVSAISMLYLSLNALIKCTDEKTQLGRYTLLNHSQQYLVVCVYKQQNVLFLIQ